MKEIDCRGLDCPEPVLKTRSALEESPAGTLKITVDNQVARDNILRFLQSKNLNPEWQESEGNYNITADLSVLEPGTKAAGAIEETAGPVEDRYLKGRPVLFISTDQIGTGNSELGLLLMRNFIYTLTKRDELPEAVLFMNAGIKLSVEGSPVLAELRELESNEVKILVCGTCLDYYGLKEQHQVGQVSNMYDIADLLMISARVVTI